MDNLAKNKISEAREKLNLLMLNTANLSMRKKLELASSIRDGICNNQSVTDICDNDEECALLRKELLDDIRSFQMSIVENNIQKEANDSFLSVHVIDLEKAKRGLSEMIETELSLNIFSEDEEPHLFDGILECDTHLKTLHQVAANCKYGKYKVLLMGDFQSGKSTTLDAFCDGRHISAIGKGTATSAVLVSATYAEKESITIHWREKEHFNTIFDRIKQYLQDFDWKTFNLDEKNSRRQLLGAIESLRKSKFCPNIGEGDAKFLMLCDFILTYYDTRELQKKKESLLSLTEISDITKFPENGESTWQKHGVKGFSIDDVIFIFIDSVECFIPSETLKELNCTIIDSPGLFNSSYDTMVTENAMKEAHAIMYVLPYYKGIGKDICKSLYTIKDNYSDFHRKLFIVNNLRITSENEFYESNCRQIESMFETFKPVYQYDAKLAYLSQIKKLYASGIADIKDYSHLMYVIKKWFGKSKNEIVLDNFDDAWAYHTRGYEVKNTPTAEILEMSGFTDMTNALKQFIADNESYAVIVSNGVVPMRRELVSIENSLHRTFIEPYMSSHDELVAIWESRIDKATNFQAYVLNEAKDKLFNAQGNIGSLHERLADEEYIKLFTSDFYKELSVEIASVLYDNKRDLLATKTLLTNKEEFKKRFSELSFPWILDKIVELVKRKIQYLHDMFDSEQDVTIINMFTPVMDKLESSLKTHWNDEFNRENDISMQDYLIIPKNLRSTQKVDTVQGNYNSKSFSGYNVDSTLIGGLIAQITVIVTGLASMIAGYISLFLLDPSGMTLLVYLGLFGGGLIIETVAPEILRKKFIKLLSQKIEPKISNDNTAKTFKSILKEHLKTILEEYVDSLIVNINKMRNERDLALTPNPNQEILCFRSLEATSIVHKQIESYDEYKHTYLKDEAI